MEYDTAVNVALLVHIHEKALVPLNCTHKDYVCGYDNASIDALSKFTISVKLVGLTCIYIYYF